MAVSMGTIFVLNSVALLTFPFIGLYLKLSQSQFGLVGRPSPSTTPVRSWEPPPSTAPLALAVGTTVKLARALWIVPLTLGTAARPPHESQNPVALVHRTLLPWLRY